MAQYGAEPFIWFNLGTLGIILEFYVVEIRETQSFFLI